MTANVHGLRQVLVALVAGAFGGCGERGPARPDAGDDAVDAIATDALVPDTAETPCTEPGALDAEFGNGGLAAPAFPGAISAAGGVAIDAQARIVVAGSVVRDGRAWFAVARYSPVGTLDPTFGTNGVTELCPDAFDACWLTDVVLDTDGGILAAGGINQGESGGIGLLRLDADGQLDPAFGTGGLVVDRPAPTGHAEALALDSQRRIVVVAQTFDGHAPADAWYFTTVRYVPSGQRDPSFGTSGIAATAFDETGYHVPGDVLVDANDRPVVVGQWTVGADSAFGVVRYAVSGTRDAAFGSNGVVKVVAGNSRWAQGVSADAAGRLVVVGGSALVRLRPDGTRDPTFGTAGVAVGFTAAQAEIAHTATGELVAVGGDSMGSWVSKLGVARYRSSGIADTTFGTDGLATHGVPGSTGAYAAHLALQPDGKIVAVGNHGNAYPDMSFLVARVCP